MTAGVVTNARQADPRYAKMYVFMESGIEVENLRSNFLVFRKYGF